MAENKGTWLDTKTNKIVASQPEEGVQLVSPNVEPSSDDLAAVDAAKSALSEDADAEKTTMTTRKSTTSK